MKRAAGFVLALCLVVLPSVGALDYDTANYRKTMIQLLGATHDATRGRAVDLGVYDAIASIPIPWSTSHRVLTVPLSLRFPLALHEIGRHFQIVEATLSCR